MIFSPAMSVSDTTLDSPIELQLVSAMLWFFGVVLEFTNQAQNGQQFQQGYPNGGRTPGCDQIQALCWFR
jgi:hypothetical protein